MDPPCFLHYIKSLSKFPLLFLFIDNIKQNRVKIKNKLKNIPEFCVGWRFSVVFENTEIEILNALVMNFKIPNEITT